MIKAYALIFKTKAQWQIMRDSFGVLKIYVNEEKAKEAASNYIGGAVKVKEVFLRFENDR
jgi:hypothetical protein